MSYLESLPEWARIVGVFIFIMIGSGGASSFLTTRLSKRKVQAEASNLDIASYNLVNKTMIELNKETLDGMNTLIDREKEARREVEERLSSVEIEVSDHKKRIDSYDRELKKMQNFIEYIKNIWATFTDKEFPDYSEWRSDNYA